MKSKFIIESPSGLDRLTVTGEDTDLYPDKYITLRVNDGEDSVEVKCSELLRALNAIIGG
ncbi:hypothetical protein [uncultured Metabacillus sp.]|uniref:hypothetical protein n=1 Tax=Metabacillus sp. Hm71 TaxID=3450743 RepID=UPI002623A4C8|nr:hypothetical protein [uncultured Metabacillus sp.]